MPYILCAEGRRPHRRCFVGRKKAQQRIHIQPSGQSFERIFAACQSVAVHKDVKARIFALNDNV